MESETTQEARVDQNASGAAAEVHDFEAMLKLCKLPRTTDATICQDISNTMTRDLISQMCDEILGCIIMKLTLRDAVKTSLLSRRWRNIASSFLVKLTFNWCSLLLTADNYEFVKTLYPCRNREYKYKFIRGVNQFLESYKGMRILLFWVNFCLGNDCTDDIDNWVRFSIRMGAEELCLDLYCGMKPCRRNADRNLEIEGKYVFRSELFEGAKTNLQHLRLVGCILAPNFTNKFSCLKRLCFVYVPLAHYDLKSMFCCLGNLKHLVMRHCSLPGQVSLGWLPLLEIFSLTSCTGITKIELSNANLISFKLKTSQSVTLDLRGVHNLKTFSHATAREGLHYVFSSLPQHLPTLRTLSIITATEWVKCVPENLSVFMNVTQLKLEFVRYTKFNILKMISILRGFPSLCQLNLMMCCRRDRGQLKVQPSQFVNKYLKEVNISGFYTPNQIVFAIYLLQNAFALQQLVIKREVKFHHVECSNICRQREPWDEAERQKVFERLQSCSQNAVVTIE